MVALLILDKEKNIRLLNLLVIPFTLNAINNQIHNNNNKMQQNLTTGKPDSQENKMETKIIIEYRNQPYYQLQEAWVAVTNKTNYYLKIVIVKRITIY